MSLVARIVLSLAVVIGLATPGPAQVAEWNQKDVTAVSQQLEEATKELYDSFYKQPTQGIGTGQARAYQELKQQLRRIRRRPGTSPRRSRGARTMTRHSPSTAI
jgi:hypothetical protein